MFSQLCKARSRTLWDKFSVRPPAQNDHRTVVDDSQPSHAFEPNLEESRCQLEHCTFCDYRVCCEIASRSHEELACSAWDLKATENPAYGLSIKNWLEFKEDHWNRSTLSHAAQSAEIIDEVEISSSKNSDSPSQEECVANIVTDDMNHYHISNQKFIQNTAELKIQNIDIAKESLKLENQKSYDSQHNPVTWSVLKHCQTFSKSAENCDKNNSNVIESFASENIKFSDSPEGDFISANKSKRNKEKTFSRSLMKPIAKMAEKKELQHSNQTLKGELSRQKPVEKKSRDKFHNSTQNDDRCKKLNKAVDPLSEIAQIKTEESIQEWLARISDSGNADDSDKEKNLHGSAWDLRSDDVIELKCKNYKNEPEISVPNQAIKQALEKQINDRQHHDITSLYPDTHEDDTTALLCNASKVMPTNIPMVVMQCSRLHSHIGSKPPFQQTSLAMGTLVTALYQESEWLYVQTPHGVEGFISAANCAPIGTINDPAPISRRPWEPCDFPIQISRHKKEEFERQQAAYIQTKLPMNGNRQAMAYVNTVKIKANFYSDRCFSNTFKTKDSIKIAKTVTDILRSSPETKVSQ